MKKIVYVLGAGFSKALSGGIMPTLKNLSEQLSPGIEKLLSARDKDYLKDITKNPELLLTYLMQNHPWKSEEEYHEDRALFYKIARKVADKIGAKEAESRSNLESWGNDFIRLIHYEKAIVVTFNYDTLVEWLTVQTDIKVMANRASGVFPPSSKSIEKKISEVINSIYVIPLTPYAQRIAGVVGALEVADTFKFLKLHGSINWFSSGSQEFPGEEIYFIPIKNFDPNSPNKISQLVDKQPIIIPPVAEKSGLYKNNSLRFQWQFTRNQLKDADEVIFLGYSLPQTDLTVRNLLQTTAYKHVKIQVADKNCKVEETYREIFGNVNYHSSIKEIIQKRLKVGDYPE